MLRAMHPDEIGGGQVLQTFRLGSERVFAGHKLTREQIVRMPAANRNALIEKNYIEVWRLSSMAQAVPGESAGLSTGRSGADAERHVIPLGFGRYDVVEGRRVNATPLDRGQAYQLAGVQEPVSRKKRQAPS